jgi:hypothetical protein
VASLDAAGRRFLHDILDGYVVTRLDAVRLLQAARCVDRIATYVSVDRTALTTADKLKLDGVEMRWRTLLARLVSELRAHE